ncbi:MAG: efflux RND transporter periplasmic adaptor subunit [Hyphomicrobiaceae bacterium]
MSGKVKRRIGVGILVLAVLAGGATAVLALKGGKLDLQGIVPERAASEPKREPEAAEVAAPTVTTVRARRGEVAETVVVSGSVVARNEVLISPEVDGLAIDALKAEEGDRVAKDQVLAVLATATLDAQLAQAEARIAQAEAAILSAKTQIAEAEANNVANQRAAERARSLKKSGFASTETVDQTSAAAAVSAARVAAARQAVSSAEADKAAAEAQRREIAWRIKHTEIKSPVAGIVSRRTARLGQLAAMAGEPLFRLIEDGLIELAADVSDVTLGRLAVGQKVAILPAGVDQPIEGHVRLLATEVDPRTRIGEVRIAIDDARRLAIGTFCRGTIELGRREGVTVPLSALSYSQGETYVQVVVEGIVARRTVTTGLIGGGRAEILAGLAEGEAVVAKAGTFLRDGDRVTPVEASSKEAKR